MIGSFNGFFRSALSKLRVQRAAMNLIDHGFLYSRHVHFKLSDVIMQAWFMLVFQDKFCRRFTMWKPDNHIGSLRSLKSLPPAMPPLWRDMA
ncbi:MAG: hypothetical protein SGJ17_02105 [Hyphomicrobiales bacterium]|nr:hypothetical protein [Hyphomicrobiales bacterium]